MDRTTFLETLVYSMGTYEQIEPFYFSTLAPTVLMTQSGTVSNDKSTNSHVCEVCAGTELFRYLQTVVSSFSCTWVFDLFCNTQNRSKLSKSLSKNRLLTESKTEISTKLSPHPIKASKRQFLEKQKPKNANFNQTWTMITYQACGRKLHVKLEKGASELIDTVN